MPSTIQAENFDEGGAGVGYVDLSAGNTGAKYRSTDADIESTSDTGGGYDVGWVQPGEWLQYTINVQTSGSYTLDSRVAWPGQGGTFHVEFDGSNLTGSLSVPNTGSWQTFQTMSASGIQLGAGQHVMRVVFDANGPASGVGNFNWFRLRADGSTPPAGTAPAQPSNLTAVAAGPTQVNLTWTRNSTDETGFQVVRKTGSTGAYSPLATVGAGVTSYSDSGLAASTQYFYRVYAANAVGASDASDEIGVTTPPANSGASTPFTGTAFALPGTLQVENFDNGGAGVAYSDTSTGNFGGSYRSTDVDVENTVDIQTTQDAGGGYDVGWTAAGEWVKYTVNVPTAGNYNMAFRVASAGAGGTFHLESNGVNKTGTLTIANTGGWQTFTTLTVPNVYLAAGQQVLKLVMDSNGSTGGVGNFNWINFTFSATQPPVAVTAPAATVASAQEVDLAWTDAVNPPGTTYYNVYRSSTAGFTPSSTTLLNPTPVSGTQYNDYTADADLTYYYQVTAVNILSQESAPVAVNAATPTGIPTNPIAAASAQEIDLTWADVINASGTVYNVYRSTTAGFTASPGNRVGTSLTAPAYNDTNVTSGTTYYYQITAVDPHNVESSPLSFAVTAASFTATTVTNMTSSLTFTSAVPASGSTCTYTWSPVTDPTGAADPSFSDNADTTANNTTATFFQAGTYAMKVMSFDGLLITTSTVQVQVAQKLTSLFTYPNAPTIALGGSYQLNAIALDQFGNTLATQPTMNWSTTQGTLSGSLYTAPSGGTGPFTATASATDGSGNTAQVTVQLTVGTANAQSAPPAQVTNLLANAVDATDVQLTWTDGAPTADGFLIEASGNSGNTFVPLGIAASTATGYLATGLGANISYRFKVVPFNSAGAGTPAMATLNIVTNNAGTPTMATATTATMQGGIAPTIIQIGNTTGLTGGQLPTDVELAWAGSTKTSYYVYYTTNARLSQPCRIAYAGNGLFGNHHTIDIPLRDLQKGGPNSGSSALVTNQTTDYFTIVATNGPAPTISRGVLQTGSGIACAQFCVPQIWFMDGYTGGDGNANSGMTPSAESTAGIYEAELYGADLHAQVHTLPWNNENNAAGQMAATAFAGDITSQLATSLLPNNIPLVLMGLSYGGGAAVGTTYSLKTMGRHVDLLGLFDPVYPPVPTNPFAGGAGNHGNPAVPQSIFTLPSNVNTAYAWWQPASVEGNYGGQVDTGDISNTSSAPSPFAWTNVNAGTGHATQPYAPTVLATLQTWFTSKSADWIV